MFNSFIVMLTNESTQPTALGTPSFGQILWPAPVATRTYTGAALLAQAVLFQGTASAGARLLRAIELLWLVEESVLVDTITADDPVTTYTPEQLVGYFSGVSEVDYPRQAVSSILTQLDQLNATAFLTGELLATYRGALSPTDKLAAVVAYFGATNG